MAIGKILDLGDKISAGLIFGVHFGKKSKNVKKCFQKKPILYCCMMKKYFFLKTKDETDYNKRSKTMPMPVS
jgi:hypothetical protein